MTEKACDGGRIIDDGDMAECVECGTRVQWDLRDDTFWGFQNCREKSRSDAGVANHKQSVPAVVTQGADHHEPTTRVPKSSCSSCADLTSQLTASTARVQELQDALKQWESWGVIEIAVRNPNVSSYMDHWEGRAIKAEASLASLEALTAEKTKP